MMASNIKLLNVNVECVAEILSREEELFKHNLSQILSKYQNLKEVEHPWQDRLHTAVRRPVVGLELTWKPRETSRPAGRFG